MQGEETVEYNIPLRVISQKLDTPLARGLSFDLSGVNTELNPESNVLLNNEANFALVPPRRKEPLSQQEEIITCGLGYRDVPENLYIRKFSPNQDQEDSQKKKAFTNDSSMSNIYYKVIDIRKFR